MYLAWISYVEHEQRKQIQTNSTRCTQMFYELFWMISIPTLSVYSLWNLYTNWYKVGIQVGVSMGNLTDLQLCSPIFNKLRSTVYSGTLTFLPISAIVTLLDGTTWANLRSSRASMSLIHPWPVAGSPLFLPWATFDTDHCRPVTSHKSCSLWRCSDPGV